MNTNFLSPTVDCVGATCNTVGEQASYNSYKICLQRAYAVFADYLLDDFAEYGVAHLDGTLRGPSIDGSIYEFVQPCFTPAERTAMITAIQNKVQEIGSGDLNAGKAIVIARWRRFDQNR
jgi:hypothetical protein